MKHIAAILLLALISSCTTLEYLSNDIDDVPKTMKAQTVVMQQVLDNYYLMGMMDYRSMMMNEPFNMVKSIDSYYLYKLKKENPLMYNQAKRFIGN